MSVPFYSRALQKKLLKASKGKQKIKLVFGPRQSGKSTLLYHHIVNSGNTMVVNLQARRFSMMCSISMIRNPAAIVST